MAAVAFLQQIEIGADAELLQGAGDTGGAQVQGPLLDVLQGGEHLIGREFAGDHPGVPGVFPEPAHVGVLLGGLLAPLGGVGVQFQDQPVRGRPQLPERQRSCDLGQYGIGLGRVLRRQDAVSSSMIRTCTGWRVPAGSAAKVDGSRPATVRA